MTDEAALAAASSAIASADLLIDAVVGTGFKPPLRGLPAALRELVANSAAPVVAVDLPSGWDADSLEQAAQDAFRADAVVTFTRPKLAHAFGHLTHSTFGPVVVAEIGSPAEAVVSTNGLSWAGAAKEIAEEPREVNANKGKYGHVLVVGGCYGTAGAPSMASLAALRAGAGLVTAAVPKGILELVAVSCAGADACAAAGGSGGRGLAGESCCGWERRWPAGAAECEKDLRGGPWAGALHERRCLRVCSRICCGLQFTDCDRRRCAQRLCRTRPIVLDGSGRTLVLTPHPGEMARLTGLSVAQVEADRIDLARSFATEHKLTLVLKGWRTLIAHPDGRIAVNTSGNPAMAKGGSGDILTGIIAAMLAQFPNEVARAVEAAVALHGLAADLAARAMDEHTVLATDTLAHLSDAFRYRAKDADGLTWLCGLNDAGEGR